MSIKNQGNISQSPQNGLNGPQSPAPVGIWQRIQRTKNKITKKTEGAIQGEFIAELAILANRLAIVDDLLNNLEAHIDSFPFNPEGEPNDDN